MTVVVADTSPLNYLVLIGHIDVLHRLYGRVLVPSEVLAELTDARAPQQGGSGYSPSPSGWKYETLAETRTIPPWSRSTRVSALRFFWHRTNPMSCCSSTTLPVASRPTAVQFQTPERSVSLGPRASANCWIFDRH